MPSKKNATPIKPLEVSLVTFEKSEDVYFWVSQLQGLIKVFVSKGDLEKSMYNLRKDLEKGMEGSVKKMDLANLKIHIEERMCHMDNTVGHFENTVGRMKDNIVDNVVKLYKILRKIFQRVMMWEKVFRKIKIVF